MGHGDGPFGAPKSRMSDRGDRSGNNRLAAPAREPGLYVDKI